MGMYKCKCNYR